MLSLANSFNPEAAFRYLSRCFWHKYRQIQIAHCQSFHVLAERQTLNQTLQIQCCKMFHHSLFLNQQLFPLPSSCMLILLRVPPHQPYFNSLSFAIWVPHLHYASWGDFKMFPLHVHLDSKIKPFLKYYFREWLWEKCILFKWSSHREALLEKEYVTYHKINEFCMVEGPNMEQR